MTTADMRTATTLGTMGLDRVATLISISARLGQATVKPLSPELAAEARAVAEGIASRLGWTIDVIEA